MASKQKEQQLVPFEFVITPLSLSLNSGTKKNILIKIGTKMTKLKQQNSSVSLTQEVIYSLLTKKYCPPKGLIKVYSVLENQTQRIDSISSFQIDQLFSDSPSAESILIDKQLGQVKVKFSLSSKKIQVSRKNVNKLEQTIMKNKDPYKRQRSLGSRQNYNLNKVQTEKSPELLKELQKLKLQLAQFNNLKNNISDLNRQIQKKQCKIRKQGNEIILIFTQKRQANNFQSMINSCKKNESSSKPKFESSDPSEYQKIIATLRQKQSQLERSLFHKDTFLQNLKKNNSDIKKKYEALKQKCQNSRNMINQQEEQIANLNEELDKYREKCGQIKNTPNKALQKSIKQTLNWIDQEINIDLELPQDEFMEPQQSTNNESRDETMSDMLKSFEIENVPIEQISIIRKELVNILTKIDNIVSG